MKFPKLKTKRRSFEDSKGAKVPPENLPRLKLLWLRRCANPQYDPPGADLTERERAMDLRVCKSHFTTPGVTFWESSASKKTGRPILDESTAPDQYDNVGAMSRRLRKSLDAQAAPGISTVQVPKQDLKEVCEYLGQIQHVVRSLQEALDQTKRTLSQEQACFEILSKQFDEELYFSIARFKRMRPDQIYVLTGMCDLDIIEQVYAWIEYACRGKADGEYACLSLTLRAKYVSDVSCDSI